MALCGLGNRLAAIKAETCIHGQSLSHNEKNFNMILTEMMIADDCGAKLLSQNHLSTAWAEREDGARERVTCLP